MSIRWILTVTDASTVVLEADMKAMGAPTESASLLLAQDEMFKVADLMLNQSVEASLAAGRGETTPIGAGDAHIKEGLYAVQADSDGVHLLLGLGSVGKQRYEVFALACQHLNGSARQLLLNATGLAAQ